MGWKYELGQRSGYLFWKCFEPDDLQNLIVYKSLPGRRYMRILQVTCSAVRLSKQFLDSLVSICVDSPGVPYIAISYTWGDPSIVAEMKCKNGKRIPITKIRIYNPQHPIRERPDYSSLDRGSLSISLLIPNKTPRKLEDRTSVF